MNEYMIPPLPTVPRYTVHAHDTVQGVSYRLPRHCQYSLTALSVEQHRAHTYTHTSTIEQYSISLPTLYYNRTMVRSTTARFFVDILVAQYRLPVRSGVPVQWIIFSAVCCVLVSTGVNFKQSYRYLPSVSNPNNFYLFVYIKLTCTSSQQKPTDATLV